jgi:GNAT superfamily N-acetyltransferase
MARTASTSSGTVLRLKSSRAKKRARTSGALRLLTRIEKDQDGLATDYSVRLAPGAIARIRLSRLSAGHAWIDWVYVPPGFRDAGVGGQLLRRVMEDADREQVKLSLEARACAGGQAALEAWYEKRGFVRTARRGQLGPIFVRPAARSREAA